MWERILDKNYECSICHKPIEKNKRLVYQEFDKELKCNFFRTKYVYYFCDECFRVFVSWIMRHKNENDLKIGVEAEFRREK